MSHPNNSGPNKCSREAYEENLPGRFASQSQGYSGGFFFGCPEGKTLAELRAVNPNMNSEIIPMTLPDLKPITEEVSFLSQSTLDYCRSVKERVEQKALMTDDELAESMRKRDAQMHADLCYDRETEARSFNRWDNPHDE